MLDPLAAPVAALQRVIERWDNQGMIIGGIAASLLGEPRLTADADALMLVSLEDLPRLIGSAQQEGLHPRISDAIDFARRNRVILLRHEASGINVDISLGILPFELEAVERSAEHHAGSLTLRLPTPEDLIILKAVAHRPKDMLDIASVISSQPSLDQERIAFWVRQFAEILDTPEIWLDVEKLLP